MATAKQTLSLVKEHFNSGDFKRKYETDEGSNTVITKMSLRNQLESTSIFIECHEVYICVRAYINIRADKKHRQSVAEYLARANADNPFCYFNMNYDIGRIWTQMALICHGMNSLPVEVFNRTFYAPASMLELYGNGLLAVMSGVKTPKEAIADIGRESGCGCGCNHDYDTGHEDNSE